MATAIEKTLDRVGNAIQSLFNGKDEPTVNTSNVYTGQTCLEATGIRQRALHLKQNMWRKNDLEYSRPLVLAEYEIQTEFLVNTTNDIIEVQKEKAAEQTQSRIEKLEKKRDKYDSEINELKKKKESLKQ